MQGSTGDGRREIQQREEAMKYVLLIYQGTTQTPTTEEWKTFTDEEKKGIYSEYEAINKTPGITLGLPLGLPKNAFTVRVENGTTRAAEGPFVGANGAVGGYYVLEADNVEAAIKVAARIPAARLGGAIEIRPAAKYW